MEFRMSKLKGENLFVCEHIKGRFEEFPEMDDDSRIRLCRACAEKMVGGLGCR